MAAGLIGMEIGSACAGLFADRFGRRMVVIASVFVFGVATGSIDFAPDLLTVAALRFIAGLGIGCASPNPRGNCDDRLRSAWRHAGGSLRGHGSSDLRLARSLFHRWRISGRAGL